MATKHNGQKATTGYVHHNPSKRTSAEARASEASREAPPPAQGLTPSGLLVAMGLAPPHAGAPSAPVLPASNVKAPRVSVLALHVANAQAAAAEIEASASFEADFGSIVPVKAPLAEGLVIAREWSEESERARLWHAYAAHERAQAWSGVLGVLEPLALAFEGLAARDPTIAARYPALAVLVRARNVTSRKAAATRRRNEKKQAVAASSTSASAQPNGATPPVTPTAQR